ncbi:hypothetical protein B484DRAFT_402905, partial [Ochromonadaceae sp. CCMP2298]
GAGRDSSLYAASRGVVRKEVSSLHRFDASDALLAEFEAEARLAATAQTQLLLLQQHMTRSALRVFSARVLQSAFRGYRARVRLLKLRAARYLGQRVWFLKYFHHRRSSAIRISARVRVHFAREGFLLHRRQRIAASKIQRLYRKRRLYHTIIARVLLLCKVRRTLEHCKHFGIRRAVRVLEGSMAEVHRREERSRYQNLLFLWDMGRVEKQERRRMGAEEASMQLLLLREFEVAEKHKAQKALQAAQDARDAELGPRGRSRRSSGVGLPGLGTSSSKTGSVKARGMGASGKSVNSPDSSTKSNRVGSSTSGKSGGIGGISSKGGAIGNGKSSKEFSKPGSSKLGLEFGIGGFGMSSFAGDPCLPADILAHIIATACRNAVARIARRHPGSEKVSTHSTYLARRLVVGTVVEEGEGDSDSDSDNERLTLKGVQSSRRHLEAVFSGVLAPLHERLGHYGSMYGGLYGEYVPVPYVPQIPYAPEHMRHFAAVRFRFLLRCLRRRRLRALKGPSAKLFFYALSHLHNTPTQRNRNLVIDFLQEGVRLQQVKQRALADALAAAAAGVVVAGEGDSLKGRSVYGRRALADAVRTSIRDREKEESLKEKGRGVGMRDSPRPPALLPPSGSGKGKGVGAVSFPTSPLHSVGPNAPHAVFFSPASALASAPASAPASTSPSASASAFASVPVSAHAIVEIGKASTPLSQEPHMYVQPQYVQQKNVHASDSPFFAPVLTSLEEIERVVQLSNAGLFDNSPMPSPANMNPSPVQAQAQAETQTQTQVQVQAQTQATEASSRVRNAVPGHPSHFSPIPSPVLPFSLIPPSTASVEAPAENQCLGLGLGLGLGLQLRLGQLSPGKGSPEHMSPQETFIPTFPTFTFDILPPGIVSGSYRPRTLPELVLLLCDLRRTVLRNPALVNDDTVPSARTRRNHRIGAAFAIGSFTLPPDAAKESNSGKNKKGKAVQAVDAEAAALLAEELEEAHNKEKRGSRTTRIALRKHMPGADSATVSASAPNAASAGTGIAGTATTSTVSDATAASITASAVGSGTTQPRPDRPRRLSGTPLKLVAGAAAGCC